MNATKEIPVVSSDAGDPVALQDPNSPASIMKKAKEMEAQSTADKKYDATAPPREGFEDCTDGTAGILHSLLLASSVLLILYAVAPNQG
jgi:hypothetical protein